MMSMGCGMVPMMFPGMQQYMPPMGMGIGMGMGMGMEMGMNRPIMPFPNVLTGSGMPTPAAAAHLGPRFPMPAFHMPPLPTTEPSRAQATNQPDFMFQSFAAQNPNHSRIPNFSDPFQQYLGSHQMQLPLQQVNSTFFPLRLNYSFFAPCHHQEESFLSTRHSLPCNKMQITYL